MNLLYKYFLRKILFLFPAEFSHHLTLLTLKVLTKLKLKNAKNYPSKPRTVMGLVFPNPVGIAAGLDKNGDYLDGLATLGAGFIEIGTVTPKPQYGNKKPRVFRIKRQQALVNHLGYSNKGIDYVVSRLKATRYRGIIGLNIGKNFTTPFENASYDYVHCFQKAASYVDYVTLNISCPNTSDMNDLKQEKILVSLIDAVQQARNKYHQETKKYIPITVKVSPELSNDEIANTAEIFLAKKIDGVIVSNTAVHEKGGLSGKPLRQKSLKVLEEFYNILQDKIPIIGVGGVFGKDTAQEKYAAGALLIQVYTGLVYQGPGLIKDIVSLVHSSQP